MLTLAYRKDYTGEFVIVNTNVRLGIKEQRREWLDNPITNQNVSRRAAVIGSAADQKRFDFRRLARHRGGLHGCLRLQTYGTADIWRHMPLDFYCNTQRPVLTQISATDYAEKSIVYTSPRFCLMFPGQFYMIPYQPLIDDLAAAIYLAAFDGQTEIFMLGYSQHMTAARHQWQQDIADVIRTYHTHQFTFVGVASNQADCWLDLDNVQTMDYRSWISYCDI